MPNTFTIYLTYTIVFLGVINLLRMTAFLVGSDIYSVKSHYNGKKKNKWFPEITVVIPAYNEEKNILNAITSVITNNYPQNKVDVIVVNDGSKDKTELVVRSFINYHNLKNVKIITQKNSGKANALNCGMKSWGNSELVMCLDADSSLHPLALVNAVKYFKDPKVMALSSNVKIRPRKGLLSIIQELEYLVCYQMKRAQTVFNIEYIIGGIGSTFRRSYLEKINYYDANTVTEDIDLTMKILQAGNKKVRVIYGADVIAYTESVLNIPDLIKQRYRWKWGRYQTFLKNKGMFFQTDQNFSKLFSWVYLPFALFGDIAFFIEPLLVLYILSIVLIFHDFTTLVSAMTVLTFYNIMSILKEETSTPKEKIKYILLAPFMYFLFYILSFVEYTALIKSWKNFPNLRKSLHSNQHIWEHVQRSGQLQIS